MFKSIVILSKLVDSTIREAMPDVDVWVFTDVQDLMDYVNERPLRGETLFITQDMLQHATTVVPHIVALLDNPFLNVDEVVCMCTKDSKQMQQVDALIKHYQLDTWTLLPCAYTRENIFGIITGSRRDDLSVVKRKIVYRVPRSKYVEQSLKQTPEVMKDEYMSDSMQEKKLEDDQTAKRTIIYSESSCQIVHIAGYDCVERTVFAFLSAQYLSRTGKTVILERDIKYHRLSDFVLRSGVDSLIIDMEDALQDIPGTINRIQCTAKNLVCLVCKSRVTYDYAFFMHILYNNLYDNISYLVSEDEFREVPASQGYTAVIPTLIPDLFRACEEIDAAWVTHANFVGVSLNTLNACRVPDSNAMEFILQDVFGVEKIESVIVNVTSTKLGEAPYDMKQALFKGGVVK